MPWSVPGCPDIKVQFACGKCHECLHTKQNSYIQLYFLEAMQRKSMHFVTLTYDNDHLPFVRFPMDFNDEGEIYPSAFGKVEFLNCVYDLDSLQIEDYFAQKYRKHQSHLVSVGDGFCYLSPSLCRHDVRSLIKVFRLKTGASFSYSFIGEYGKLGRPHYHGLLFGLNDDQVAEFCRSWKKGFTKWSNVPLVSRSGKSCVEAAAKYCSKYMHKGSLDDEKVIEKVVEVPRVISSVRLGSADMDRLADFYLARDLFPDADPFADSFSEDYLMTVERRLQSFSINGHEMYLGKHLKGRIFKYDYKNPETGATYKKSTPLQLTLAARLQSKSAMDLQRRISEVSEGEDEISAIFKVHSILDSEESMLQDRAINAYNSHKNSLKQSKL